MRYFGAFSTGMRVCTLFAEEPQSYQRSTVMEKCLHTAVVQ